MRMNFVFLINFLILVNHLSSSYEKIHFNLGKIISSIPDVAISNKLGDFEMRNLETKVKCAKLHDFPINKTIKIETSKLRLNFSLSGNMNNPTLNGEPHFKDLDLEYNGTLKDFYFKGVYEMEGMALGLLPLKGSGSLNLILGESPVAISLQIDPIGGVLFINQFLWEYDVMNLQVDVGGLFDDDDAGKLLQAFIKDFVPNTLHLCRHGFSHLVEDLLKEKKLRLDDIYASSKAVIDLFSS